MDSEDVVEFKLSLTQRIVSASVGALLTSIITTPLDVVKIRLQAQAENSCNFGNNPASCPKCAYISFHNGLMDHTLPRSAAEKTILRCRHTVQHFKGTLDALLKIPRYEGILSLYNGLPPTLLMAVPATVLYFASYDKLRLYFDSKQLDWKISSIMAGSLARITAASVVSPLELTRTKMQAMQDPPNMFRTALMQVRTSGILSLWRGLAPTLLRDVPFSAVYWVSVEATKRHLMEHWMHIFIDKRVVSFVAGLSGGTLAAVLTHPFDVIKTRKQVFDYSEDAELCKSRKMTTSRIFVRILQEEGISGLFTGLAPRVSRVAPACAIMLSSYEAGKLFFGGRAQNKALM